MLGPPGPTGPAGPPGVTPTFTAINGTLWADSPPSTVEEAINRIAASLYSRTATQGPLHPVPAGSRILILKNNHVSTTDCFVAKYNTDGIAQWLRRIGGTNHDGISAVATDSDGNVYVGGTSGGSVFAADDTTTVFSLNPNSSPFILKYNSDGTPIWVSKLTQKTTSSIGGITTDSSGNIYVTGSASGSVTFFDASDQNILSLGTRGHNDIFVTKYNASGTPIWARRAGGGFFDYGNGITVDSDGNVYIATGMPSNNTTIKPIVFAANDSDTAFELSYSGTDDAYIIKYTSDGTPTWVRRIGGTGSDKALGITNDSSGNIYVTGSYNFPAKVFPEETQVSRDNVPENTATFTLNIENSGRSEAFVVKYMPNGTPVWARRIGAGIVGAGIAATSSGNIYVTGYGGSPVKVYTANNTIAISEGVDTGEDAFVVKYDTDGTPSWLRRIIGVTGNGGIDRAHGISLDPSENVYITGFSSGPASVLDGSNNIAISIGSSSFEDAFVVKYTSSGTPTWARRIGGTGSDRGTAIASDSESVYVVGTSSTSNPLILFPSSL